MTENLTKLPSVNLAIKCNNIAVGRDVEEGERMEVESTRGEQATWIAAATKKAINKAMGRDYKKTCQP